MALGCALADAELQSLLERLPYGLESALGEGGGLISGGEGQRVRLGRSLMRQDARLVLLDEAFRGLERPLRRRLLERARGIWSKSTLLCVAHDIADAIAFDRVLVIESGRIVEDGSPSSLRLRPDSRFSAMYTAELAGREALADPKVWRQARIEDGRLSQPKIP